MKETLLIQFNSLLERELFPFAILDFQVNKCWINFTFMKIIKIKLYSSFSFSTEHFPSPLVCTWKTQPNKHLHCSMNKFTINNSAFGVGRRVVSSAGKPLNLKKLLILPFLWGGNGGKLSEISSSKIEIISFFFWELEKAEIIMFTMKWRTLSWIFPRMLFHCWMSNLILILFPVSWFALSLRWSYTVEEEVEKAIKGNEHETVAEAFKCNRA